MTAQIIQFSSARAMKKPPPSYEAAIQVERRESVREPSSYEREFSRYEREFPEIAALPFIQFVCGYPRNHWNVVTTGKRHRESNEIRAREYARMTYEALKASKPPNEEEADRRGWHHKYWEPSMLLGKILKDMMLVEARAPEGKMRNRYLTMRTAFFAEFGRLVGEEFARRSA
jgi:hypothetical protein